MASLRIFGMALLLGFMTIRAFAGAQPFVHPGMLHDRAELEFVKAKIKAGEEPWKSAWEQLRTHPYAQRDYKPRPVADVYRGPYNNPDNGSTEIMTDSCAAYTQALAWALTGDKAHAARAAAILNAWSATLKSIKGHDARLLTGMAGIGFLNAAELLAHTGADWPAADRQAFARLVCEVLYPIIQDFFPGANGNWDAAMIQTMLAMGVFLDDRAIFERAVNHCLNGRTNGAIAHYFNADGECQESGRDQAHTQMGLGYLGNACEIAWKQGVDMYGALDSRLARGFEYTARYNLGHDVPYVPYRSIEGKNFYPELSDKARGQFSPIYEKVYRHYHGRKGLELPFTKQAVEKIRPEAASTIYHMPWGTLMYANQPIR